MLYYSYGKARNYMCLLSWLPFFGKHKFETERDIKSPSGRIVCHISLKSGKISYEVKKDGKTIIKPSRLGIVLKGEDPLGINLVLIRLLEKSVNENWETSLGEERIVKNQYNEATFYLSESSKDKRLLTLRFRVFDDGVAFRYEIQPQPKFRRLIVADEMTEFDIDSNSYIWQIPAYQPDRYEYNYERSAIYDLKNSIHTPATIETPSGYFVAIHEASLYNYGSMTLKTTDRHVLISDITPLSDGMRAYVDLPFDTPWRVIMIGDSAIDLASNRMIYNLNDPPKEDFSWVKPLKFLGIWWAMYVGEWTWAPGERHGATTEHAKEYIDACNRLGLNGLLVEGWNNGWEGDWLQNGASNDYLHPMNDFNLEEVAKYASDHKVSLIGHHETVGFVDNYEQQMEQAYQYYAKNNIKYIKSGYVGSKMTIQGRKEYHHSQVGVKHYQKALELAAKHHIMLDVHEPIKGTGIERTWPNLLTREGARGQEYEGGAISPSHACILPFTRLLSGGMDYTSGIFDVANGTKRMATTLARQLAYYVTIFSPMQMAADRPRFYEGENAQAFEFIRTVPTTWERSLPLLGEIGKYFVIARQGLGEMNWYIGGTTNEEAHRVRLTLDFLDIGEYEATIYRDADSAHYRDNQLAIIIEHKKVTRTDFLDLWMAPGGGFAVKLTLLPGGSESKSPVKTS